MLRIIIDWMNETSKKHYVANQKLGLDERCSPFKGRCRAKMYNPSKPAKLEWHLKDFVLAESDTGFVLKFFPYQGKDAQRPAGMSLAEWTVKTLLTEEYWNK